MGGNVNRSLRKIIFWLHLLAGVIAGVVIFIMSVTGAALAFEKDLIAWAERDLRHVPLPATGVERLPLEDLLARAQATQSGERPSGITLDADPGAAVLVSFGRANVAYVNPYTGAVRPAGAPRLRAFMRVMTDWHRYLGGSGERRALGKTVTGAGNAAFLFLAVSGLYLWWPRQWTQNTFRAVAVMNFKLRGKARDWNWHNAVGLWSAPVLIVLTATAMPISYAWASNLIYKITGSPLPAQAGPPGMSSATVELPTPPKDARPLGLSALFAAAQKEFPNWKQISQRSGAPGGRGPRAGGVPANVSTNATSRGSQAEGAPTPRERGGERRPTPRPVTLTVVERNQWPLFSSTQLTLDPFTGATLRQETFGDLSAGRRVRSWTRFLHTGEALGTIGKAVAGLASVAGALLVWTGFALAWRRFFPQRKRELVAAISAVEVATAQAAIKE